MVSVQVIGRRVIRLGTVASTMDEVAALAAAGEPEGTIVIAEEQTAGRGRAGRAWRAPSGSALLCSLLLRPTIAASRITSLPLVIGVAVAEAIERVASMPVWLKWPNDVWLGGAVAGRKVAGILMTARSAHDQIDHVIIGIGINVDAKWAQLPDGATSLAVETGRAIDRGVVEAALIERLDVGYRTFVTGERGAALDGWRSRAALLDQPVTVDIAGQRRDGIMRGIDDSGALLLARADGVVERIVAGDLVRGPIAGATA